MPVFRPCLFAVATILLLSTLPAVALDCADARTTYDMDQCTGQDLKREDARLNRIYQQVLKAGDEDAKKLLRDAQRKWIAFRDANCEWAADAMRGGTAATLIHGGCMVKMTRSRADEIEYDLKNR